MLINGLPLRAWGFHTLDRPNPPLNATTLRTAAVQGRPGDIITGSNTSGKMHIVRGHVIGTDRADALAKTRQILALCRRGGADYPVRIQHTDSDIEWLGVLDESASNRSDVGKSWISRTIMLTLAFRLPDPRGQSLTDTTIECPNGESVDLDLGDAPSALHLTASTLGPVRVDLLSTNDEEIDVLQWAPAAGGGYLEIDGDTCLIREDGANGMHGLDPGSTAWPFVADPERAIARIRVTGADATVTYRRRWWA